MTKLRTHYDNLKVARDAPDFVIRAAYKTLSQKYHPDKNPDDPRATRVMSLINQSYEVLSDPEQRREHDAWIAREEAKLKAQAQPQSPPIPPQWEQPEAPPPPAAKNWFVSLLLFPVKLLVLLFVILFEFSPALTLLGLLMGGLWIWSAFAPDTPPAPGPKPYQTVAPDRSRQASSQAAYTRPKSAPNGSSWPSTAGYVDGYPVDNQDGQSEVTVDNSRNDADVFAKLVSLEDETAYPVRQFYIPSGSKFTMNKVRAGQYDLRYLDLVTGKISRSESFEVEESRTATGIEYSSMTMTLYKVQHGNFHTFDLSVDEF